MTHELDPLLRRAMAPDTDTDAVKSKTDTPTDAGSATAPVAKATARPRADQYLTGLYIALCVISVVELYSASSREISGTNIFAPLIRHLFMLTLGIAICFGVSRLKVSTIVRLTPLFVLGSVAMMLYVLVAGDIINGARRSFTVAGTPIQPSEFIKISAVLIIAYIAAKNQIKGGGVRTKGIFLISGTVLFFGGMLFSQGLTNTLLLMGISVAMMIIGGIEWKKLGLVFVIYGLIGGIGIAAKMSDGGQTEEETATIVATGKDSSGKAATANRGSTWGNRMSRYFNDSLPLYEQPITALNRQEMYSYMAQANGGLSGVHPGNSRETARLPLAFSDYIFSIVVEDWGFIGGIFLLIIYLSVGWRAGGIATRCARAFPAMLVMGLAVMIILQALFHMGITTGVFPVSGQPLPMISKGGTSMIITSLAFGIMLSVSRYAAVPRKNKKTKQTNIPSDTLPEGLEASNPSQL